jgi:hypothetical protein
MKSLEKKACEKGMSLEYVIYRDAGYVAIKNS